MLMHAHRGIEILDSAPTSSEGSSLKAELDALGILRTAAVADAAAGAFREPDVSTRVCRAGGAGIPGRSFRPAALGRGSLRRSLHVLPAVILIAGALTSTSAARAPNWSAASAPDGPGATSYLDLGRKDCLGSATTAHSRVWFTLADGVLSDVYSPTTDNTNLKTLQYIVTDGRSFTDLQTRSTTYSVHALDQTGMSCEVVATARSGRYRLISDYIADPARDSVVIHTRYVPLTAAARSYRVYVRYNAMINGAGGGGAQNGGANSATIVPAGTGAQALVSYQTLAKSSTPQRDYEVPLYGALVANRAYPVSSTGFVGEPSDGLEQLDSRHSLGPTYRDALNGNVEQTGELATGDGSFTLALGYGQTQAAAVGAATESAHTPFALTDRRYLDGWQRYDAGLRVPPDRLSGLSAAQDREVRAQYWTSANVIKATADKEFPGAIVSSLADPWGQATTANGLSSGQPNVDVNYRVIFERDFYETFTGFLADGDMATARAQASYIFDKVQLPDGSFPRDALINGATAPDNYVLEPDEQAFPLIMAYQAGLAGDHQLYFQHVVPAADFLVAHGPVYGDERWEDQAGYSPSNIATEIAGLVSAAALAQANHDPQHAKLWLDTADDWRRQVERWTVTTTGPYSDQPYFLRLSKRGDPNAPVVYNLGNGSIDADQRSVIDAGFLELTRFGELTPSDPLIANSLKVVDKVLGVWTPSGFAWHRYGTLFESVGGQNVPITGSTDGYGDCYAPAPMQCPLTGRPWIPWFTGTGHVWPLLNGERGEQDIQTADPRGAATNLLDMARLATGAGMIPEQDWENPDVPPSPFGSDPTTASIGFIDGKPAGSAGEITWVEAGFVRLAQDLGAGRLLEQPRVVRARYVDHAVPAAAPLSATATQTATGVTVSGTTAPGASVVVAATLSPPGATDPGGTAHSQPVPTDVAQSTAGGDGSFSTFLPLSAGTWLVTVTASEGSATAHQQLTLTVS
jgi:glucoamylase